MESDFTRYRSEHTNWRKNKRAQKIINNERFLLTYGDGISDVNINKTIEYHEKMEKK